jgi:hypothetical protein
LKDVSHEDEVGYSPAELDDIQLRWKLQFPPDLLKLLAHRRPLLSGGFDWIDGTHEEIELLLRWPAESFMFDVLENGLWWQEWGPSPPSSSGKIGRVTELLADAPRLIPLGGHRYIPETPSESGNPVFSVYQSDIIYYGADLADWILREEHGWSAGRLIDPSHPPKEIPLWSEAVRRNV